MIYYHNNPLVKQPPFPDDRSHVEVGFSTYISKPHYVSNFNKLTKQETININCLDAGYINSLGEEYEKCDIDLLAQQITEELNYAIMDRIKKYPVNKE